MLPRQSRRLNVEAHQLVLAISEKTIDENLFSNAQAPPFKLGDGFFFKNKQPGKWDLKWIPGYRIVCIESDRHYMHVEN